MRIKKWTRGIAAVVVAAALGVGAGALIGDQMQAQENRNYAQDQQIRRQQYEIDRLRQERGEY